MEQREGEERGATEETKSQQGSGVNENLRPERK